MLVSPKLEVKTPLYMSNPISLNKVYNKIASFPMIREEKHLIGVIQ